MAEIADPPLFCATAEGANTFPCGANILEGVSLGIAAGGLGLLMTVYLTKKVSIETFSFYLFMKANCGIFCFECLEAWYSACHSFITLA